MSEDDLLLTDREQPILQPDFCAGRLPRVMASPRNLAISVCRQDGHTNIAAATRHHARHPGRPLATLGWT